MLAYILLGYRMVVNNAKEACVVGSFLQMDPVFDSTQVIAEMDEASWLNATENSFLNDFVCGGH